MMMRLVRRHPAAFLIFSGLIVSALIAILYPAELTALARENGPIEAPTSLSYAVAAGLFLAGYLKGRDSGYLAAAFGAALALCIEQDLYQTPWGNFLRPEFGSFENVPAAVKILWFCFYVLWGLSGFLLLKRLPAWLSGLKQGRPGAWTLLYLIGLVGGVQVLDGLNYHPRREAIHAGFVFAEECTELIFSLCLCLFGFQQLTGKPSRAGASS